ncbi:MAG: hypothetical protein ACM30H_09340 [Clostridia bacterium]
MRDKQRLLAGWGAVAVGLFGFAMVFLHPENLRAEAWVAYAGMAAFVLAGASLLFREYGARRAGEWLTLATVLGMLVVSAWISFGPGPRNCTALLFFINTAAAEWACRGAFGVGTLLLVVVLAMVARRLLR